MPLFRGWDPDRVYRIPVDRVFSNLVQIRRSIDPKGIERLAGSMRQCGLLSPVLVRPIAGGKKFELIAGQRRLLAAKQLGWAEIPALVREIEAEQAFQLGLTENIHRAGLSAVEEAEAVDRLAVELAIRAPEDLSRTVGIPTDAIERKRRLLRLSPVVREAVISGVLSEEHAEELLALPSADLQVEALRTVHRRGLSVKETHAWVLEAVSRLGAPAVPAPSQAPAPVEAPQAPPRPPGGGWAEAFRDGSALLDAAFHGDGGLADDVDGFVLRLRGLVGADPVGAIRWLPPSGAESSHLVRHLLRTAAHSLFLGGRLGIPPREQQLLGASTLFCDVGLKEVPHELLSASRALSVEERQVVERHVLSGGDRLAKAGLDGRSIRIVQQHHERFNGTGYPLRSKGSAIDPLALWVGLMDMYTALAEPRPWRRAATPRKAVQQVLLLGHRGIFPKHLLRDFIHAFGIFPVGSAVRLRSGRTALVVRSNPESVQKPAVRLPDGSVLDLAASEDEIVSEAIL